MARSSKKNSAAKLAQLVKEFINQQKNNTFNYKQVSHAIGASTPKQQRAVALTLAEMAFDGELIETSPGKYKAPMRTNFATGTFVRRSNGKRLVELRRADSVDIPGIGESGTCDPVEATGGDLQGFPGEVE